MTVDTDQKYQENVKTAANIFCQLKQGDQLNKGHAEMAIPSVGKVLHVSSYPLIESMSFDTAVSGGVAKLRVATILGDIFRLIQLTKHLLKYVHTNSNYGHLVEIPASDTKESFSRAAKYKGWVEDILLHLSVGKE